MGFLNQSAATLLLGTLSVASLHALIPSHWLAFAIVGRSQKWPVAQTLRITALAGAGHVLMTTLLGLAVAGIGKTLWRAIPPQAEHGIAAGVLILLGVYFIVSHLRGGPGHHDHAHHNPLDAHTEEGDLREHEHALRSSQTVMGALVMGMTLSPCLDLLSVYVAASLQSWALVLAAALLMATVTLTLMVTFVWLTLRGLERVRFDWLERHEGAAVGTALVLLGVVLLYLR